MFDGEAQSEMLYRAVDLGLATYQKPFLSALKYCRLSEQFDKFRLDHEGDHHTLCPPKMKGHGEDKDLKECWLSSEGRDRVSHFNTGLESQYWKSADQGGLFK